MDLSEPITVIKTTKVPSTTIGLPLISILILGLAALSYLWFDELGDLIGRARGHQKLKTDDVDDLT